MTVKCRPARNERRNVFCSAALAALSALGCAATANAAPPPIMTVVTDDENGKHDSDPLAFLQNWRREQGLLGDIWGLRTELSHHGVTLAIQETSEALGNPVRGYHKSLDYDGLTQAVLQVNTQRAFGLYGGTFNVSALQLHGLNLSARNLGTIQTASGIESDRATRLWEVWYDQKLLPEDRLDVRIGQQSLDQEWMVSTNALLFVNTMFGWPALPSYDMPGGGPAYPLSAPGIRLRYRPVNALAIQFGAFSSSPFTKSNYQAVVDGDDPQQLDPHGTSFPFFKHGTMLLAELQYTTPALGGMVSPGGKQPLSGTYRLGVWYNTEHFPDVRYGTDGLLLTDPASNGLPVAHRGNLGIYGVIDKMIWRSSVDPNRTLSAFTRVMGTPFANRNELSFSANLGLVLKDPFPYRTDDSLAVGMGFARVSSDWSSAQVDGGAIRPTSETYVEVTYQRQITPWLQIQPDMQYVFNPGGGITDDGTTAGKKVGNELVVGVRANIAL